MDLKKINFFRKRENFPVASFLFPRKARTAVRELYNFARTADELADDHNGFRIYNQSILLRTLEGFKNKGSDLPEFTQGFYHLCIQGRFDIRNGIALLEAFIDDCNVSKEYKNWDDTLAYCNKSAATIGKLFLEACKEFDCDIKKADKICIILQLLNHLQDLKGDYKRLQRAYFDRSFFPNPQKFLQEKEGLEVKNGKLKVLEKLSEMLTEARDFPQKINSFRVRAELFTIVEICASLIRKLQKNDILKSRVELNKIEKITCFFRGVFFATFKKPDFKLTKILISTAKSSFIRPLKTLKGESLEDMLSFYAFCRRVDDFADGETSLNPKEDLKNFFDQVNAIDNIDYNLYPEHPLVREVNLICKKYGIHKNYLLHIINGQVMDISGKMLFPEEGVLDKYCFNVASCVGIASVRIFGFNEENSSILFDFAVKLGKALQLINILRDVEEDAKLGRIYVTKESALKYQFPILKPYELSLDYKSYLPRLKPVFREMAKEAEKKLYTALNMIPKNEIDNMKPAILMAKIYETYLKKMKYYDFEFKKSDIVLTTYEKFQIFFN